MFQDHAFGPYGGENIVSDTIPLVDNHKRRITYLRLSVTDRCNLRCRYCCPEEGIKLVSHDEILSFEEIIRIVSLFGSMGVDKVRVTGGEPFARLGLLELLTKIKNVENIKKLHLTTNGVQAAKNLDALVAAGIDGINLSLDTLDRERYKLIARRDRLQAVLGTLHGALARSIPLKINTVIQEDTSDREIRELVRLTRNLPVTVRFIEQMPFSGAELIQQHDDTGFLARLQILFPGMKEQPATEPTTARIFDLPGYSGAIGIIEGNSRHFCKKCNKVRITATGILKTCLYDNGVLDLKELLRTGCSDNELRRRITHAVQHSSADGHIAEKTSSRLYEPSMAAIGG